MQAEAKRARNFIDTEKALLFDIAMQYKHIIENKKTDGTTVTLKNDAWTEILGKYNANSQTGPRNVKQLRALYDMIKKKARKNLHDDKKNLYKTGGGTFIPHSDILDKRVAAILKPQYEPLKNCFDSSTTYFQGELEENLNEEAPISETIETETSEVLSPSLTNELSYLPLNSPEIITSTSPSDLLTVSTPPTCTKKTDQQLSAKKRKNDHMEIVSKRVIDRKNFKDKLNQQVYKKKEEIFSVEIAIKQKQLEAVNMDLLIKEAELKKREKDIHIQDLEIKMKNEEIEHRRHMQKMEHEIKQNDLEIKRWEYETHYDEYNLYLESK